MAELYQAAASTRNGRDGATARGHSLTFTPHARYRSRARNTRRGGLGGIRVDIFVRP
ncbi:MAG TPA: hypothetical protein VGB61_11270 [Pyrinomonadaceae bacterium]